MPDMSWREAVVEVLEQSEKPLSSTEIVELIVDRGLRTNVGATPANSVGQRSVHQSRMKEKRPHLNECIVVFTD